MKIKSCYYIIQYYIPSAADTMLLNKIRINQTQTNRHVSYIKQLYILKAVRQLKRVCTALPNTRARDVAWSSVDVWSGVIKISTPHASYGHHIQVF